MFIKAMVKNGIKKFLYSTTFLSIYFLAGILPANAYEVIKAQEITGVTGAQAKNVRNIGKQRSVFSHTFHALGSDVDEAKPVAEKPEIHIKSLGEFLDERRTKKKAQAVVEAEEIQTEDIQIFCKEMEYLEDTNEIEAKEDVVIITKEGTKVTADKAIYNRDANTIKLMSNVVLTKGTSTISGEYMFIDLNEENALMDEPTTTLGNIVVNAKEGYAYPNRIETLNGNIEFNDKVEMELYTRGFLSYANSIPDSRFIDFDLKSERSKPYSFKSKEIIINPEKDTDSVLMKDLHVLYKNKTILRAPSVEMFQDKERTRSEIDFPLAIGSMKGLGLFVGLGHTFKLPKAQTLRLTPAFVYDSEVGIGGMAQYKSKKARLEAGWGSPKSDLIFDGEIKLANKFKLNLGRHAYKSEWIAGGNRAGYLAELSYDDAFQIKDLGGATFRHKITAGYVADYKREHQEDDMHDGYRYRYQAQLSKNLMSIGSEEQDVFLNLGVVGQIFATAYSQGDTVGVFRFGPSIQSRVKRWNSRITYQMGGVHGASPYYFDEYRYGRQSVNFDESLILNKFLSVGYRGTLTLLKDNRDGDLLTENRLYAVVGPEDFKLAFSYDTIRQNMYLDFLFLLGSDNMNMQYEKLTANDPDKLGKHQKRPSDKDLYKVKIPDTL